MKANELMIGDWVLYGRRYVIVKRLEYARCDILVAINSRYDDIVTETYDNIEPISITAEILEKNGFGDSFATNEKIFKCEDFEIWIDFKEQGYWACIKNKVSDLYFEGNKRYVHELQHALRLCGIDKKIVL